MTNDIAIMDEHHLFHCSLESAGRPCMPVKVDRYEEPGKEASTEGWVVVEPGEVGLPGLGYGTTADWRFVSPGIPDLFGRLEVLRLPSL